MAAICDFFFAGLRHCGEQIRPLTDIFDTFGVTSDITTVISAIHMHCYCKNYTGREGVNFIGEGGVKCVPRGVFLTVLGCDCVCNSRDLRSYIAGPYDLCCYTGETDRRLCLH